MKAKLNLQQAPKGKSNQLKRVLLVETITPSPAFLPGN